MREIGISIAVGTACLAIGYAIGLAARWITLAIARTIAAKVRARRIARARQVKRPHLPTGAAGFTVRAPRGPQAIRREAAAHG